MADLPACSGNSGIAVVMVLWVLAILITLSLSFAYISRTNLSASANVKEMVKANMIAEAGINQAVVEILHRRANPTDDARWKIDGVFRKIDFADGSYKIRIVSEHGKVDLNAADDILLKGLLNALGIDNDTQDIIVDSIQDWKDPDDLVRLHGAESDYYMSLPHPYKAKNAPFDSIEELLLVRGITPEIFYGNGTKKGLKDVVTIYNNQNATININTAPKEVLMALPNMTEDMANQIIERRNTLEFKQFSELQTMFPDVSSPAMIKYIDQGFTEGDVFMIDSIGNTTAYKGASGIKAVVSLQNNNLSYLYYKTPETFDLSSGENAGDTEQNTDTQQDTGTEHNTGTQQNTGSK
ncbi:MAG: general secretion pathway protein GspK [Nitrospirae bacterium]|nr:general secretion pathway protein GspK [Nitrospirota bacterium]